jgi:biotin transport system substrate-specific component
VVVGALVVAVGAQIAVTIPGTAVPLTFQVPAVLVVGGLLGPRLGAASLGLYLLMGLGGLPVFAPMGAPGVARLVGPTGGYLLAFPVAAAVVGAIARPAVISRTAVAVIAGLLIIHAGGVAQLAVLGGDLGVATRLGSIPFLLGDVLKLLLAGLLIVRFAAPSRAHL